MRQGEDDGVQGGQSLTSRPFISTETQSPLSPDRNQRRLQVLDPQRGLDEKKGVRLFVS